jgi:TrmH family RNA methyltransferase
VLPLGLNELPGVQRKQLIYIIQKVVQATIINCKGKCELCGFKSFISNTKLPVFGNFMDGLNIYKLFCREGIIIMGNEANGIEEFEKLIKKDSQYPRFGDIQKTESCEAANCIVLLSDRRSN